MTTIDDAAEVIGRYVHSDFAEDAARDLAAEGLLMPDLPEPTLGDDGWAEWGGEVAFRPTEGLWSYDNGTMTLDSPDRLREVALIYLAAANYAERNQA